MSLLHSVLFKHAIHFLACITPDLIYLSSVPALHEHLYITSETHFMLFVPNVSSIYIFLIQNHLQYYKVKFQLINWVTVLAGMCLKNASKKSLWKEETRQPIGWWCSSC